MGNITVSRDSPDVWGQNRVAFGTLNLSSSYATGGDSYTAAQFGMNKITRLILNLPDDGVNQYVPDEANSKILGYTAAGAELGAVDLSGNACGFIAIGK